MKRRDIKYFSELSPGDMLEINKVFFSLKVKFSSFYNPVAARPRFITSCDYEPYYTEESEGFYYIPEDKMVKRADGKNYIPEDINITTQKIVDSLKEEYILRGDISQVFYLGRNSIKLLKWRQGKNTKALIRREKWGLFCLLKRNGSTMKIRCSPSQAKQVFSKYEMC